MKTLKSTLVGTKMLDETSTQFVSQVREFLSSHREKLVVSILRDLPLYIDYRYKVKASKAQLDEIKLKLLELKNCPVDRDRYDLIFKRITENGLVHISSESFQQEIDELIAHYVPRNQLSLID